MKILHISDTHTYHQKIDIPPDIDCIIHSGDAANTRNRAENALEMIDFIKWFDTINVKHKIYIPGNHDVSVEAGIFSQEDFEKHSGITCLIHESVTIEGIKIFGSPYTPSFGTGWAYNVSRSHIHDKWMDIPLDTDILVTHGPPKQILDIAYSRENNLEHCGCTALANRILEVKPKIVCFGHIHDHYGELNHGVYIRDGVTYSNGSCAIDGYNIERNWNQGNVLTIN